MRCDEPGKPGAFSCGPKLSSYPVCGGAAGPRRAAVPPAAAGSPGHPDPRLPGLAWAMSHVQALDVTSVLKSSCFWPYISKKNNKSLHFFFDCSEYFILKFWRKIQTFGGLYLLWMQGFFQANSRSVFFLGECSCLIPLGMASFLVSLRQVPGFNLYTLRKENEHLLGGAACFYIRLGSNSVK